MNIYKDGKVVAEYDVDNVSIITDDVKLCHYVMDGVVLNKKCFCADTQHADDLVIYRPDHALFFTAFKYRICMDGYSVEVMGDI
jgi:hypothetical protein